VADALSLRSDHLLSTANTSELLVQDLIQEIKEKYPQDEKCQQMLEELERKYPSPEEVKNQEKNGWALQDGVICVKERVYVPNDKALKTKILFEFHDSVLAAHRGIAKTTELVSRKFTWPGLYKDVAEYVSTCLPCQSNKAGHQLPAGKLQPLAIPEVNWNTVSMDFIGPLKPSKSGKNMIAVFVDKLSKQAHFAACTTSITAPETAKLFLEQVVRHHGIPRTIVSDRDVRFTANFWKHFWSQLGTKLAMSTAFHPQTDGQTEVTNKILEEMLRNYVDYNQTNWDQHLVEVEMAYNNSRQVSTGFSPFFLNTGQHPNLPITLAVTAAAGNNNPTSEQMLDSIQKNLEQARKNLEKAQQTQSKYADKKRRTLVFEEGDRVMVSTANMRTDERAKKLLAKYIGPFTIVKKNSDVSYVLELPATLKIHPVFHVSLLKKYQDGSEAFPERVQEVDANKVPESEVLEEGEQAWEVEAVVDKRVRSYGRSKKKELEYLVLWKGFPEWEKTWEPAHNLRYATDKIQEYQDRNKNRTTRQRRK